jgi:nitronate monooxygenase
MQHAEEEAARYAAARRADDMGVAAVIAGEASGLIRDVPSGRPARSKGCKSLAMKE